MRVESSSMTQQQGPKVNIWKVPSLKGQKYVILELKVNKLLACFWLSVIN
jgi:hypothetical protein